MGIAGGELPHHVSEVLYAYGLHIPQGGLGRDGLPDPPVVLHQKQAVHGISPSPGHDNTGEGD